jgi:ABC-type branched-subunit amino acid transport system substrate-binding protein
LSVFTPSADRGSLFLQIAAAEQTRARIRAGRELSAGDAGARADLQRCRARTPELG